MPKDSPQANRLANSQVSQIFIALAIIVLAIFMAVTWNVLGKIGEESRRARLFLESWLSAKADSIALIAAPESIQASLVLREIDRCDSLFAALAEEDIVDRATKLKRGRVADIVPLWVGLRDSLRSPTAFPKVGSMVDSTQRIAALMARSTKLEVGLNTRLVSIGQLESGQNRAFLTLFVAILAAFLALVVGSALLAISAARDRIGRLRLEELMGATLVAQEAERTRIALDLHDSVAQDLAASLMAARRLAEDGAGSKDFVISSLQTAINSIRRVAWEMRLPELGRLGFRGAALDLVEDFARRRGLRIDVTADDTLSRGPDQETSVHLYRIIQEALANIGKHSHASRIYFSLSEGEGGFSIEIEDDGDGFDRQEAEDRELSPAHLGIAGMKERARLAGGTLEIVSSPGHGTRLKVEVPLAK